MKGTTADLGATSKCWSLILPRMRRRSTQALTWMSWTSHSSQPQCWRTRNDSRRHIPSGPALSTTFLAINPSWGPFIDPRVRRALVLAINRCALASHVLGGRFFPATGGFVPSGMPGHTPGVALPHDPDQARWLLAQAGYPGGRGMPVIEAMQPVKDVIEGQTEYLQHEWQEQLGLTVRWQTVEFEPFVERLDSGHMPPAIRLSVARQMYPILTISCEPDYGGEMLSRQIPPAAPMPKRPRVAQQAERMALYRRIEAILASEAVVVPLAYGRVHLLLQPWVRGYPTSPMKWWFWKDVIIDEH